MKKLIFFTIATLSIFIVQAQNIDSLIIKANQGHAEALNNLACFYIIGQGCLKNENKAFDLYEKAAKQGYADSQYNLGVYYYGRGYIKDFKKYFYWYEKTNNINYKHKRDYKKALSLYEKAAKQDCAVAQYALTMMYIDGEGCEQNYSKAAYWCKRAYENGDKQAKNIWDKYELWKYDSL